MIKPLSIEQFIILLSSGHKDNSYAISLSELKEMRDMLEKDFGKIKIDFSDELIHDFIKQNRGVVEFSDDRIIIDDVTKLLCKYFIKINSV